MRLLDALGIVIADFAVPTVDGAPEIQRVVPGERAYYQSMANGVVDSRPRVARHVADDWNRVHQHGGIFCVFADDALDVTYQYGEQTRTGVSVLREAEMSVWDMVEPLGGLVRSTDHGSDIRPTADAERLELANS